MLNELHFKLEKRRKDIHEQVRAYQIQYEKLQRAQIDSATKLAKEKRTEKMAPL